MLKAKARSINAATQKLHQSVRNLKTSDQQKSNCQYDKQTITEEAELLFKNYGGYYNCVRQFGTAADTEELKVFLENPDRDSNLVFVIYRKNSQIWVLLCLIKVWRQHFILYKDPAGGPIADDVRQIMSDNLKNVVFRHHIDRDPELNDEKCSGRISLEHLNIMLAGLKDNPLGFVDNFEKVIVPVVVTQKKQQKALPENLHHEKLRNNEPPGPKLENLRPLAPDGHWYDQEEIATIAKGLFDQHGGQYTFADQFEIVGSVEQLAIFLKKPERHQNLSFVVYNQGGIHWIIFCIIKQQNEFHVLYKDTTGTPIGSDIKSTLTTHMANVRIKCHPYRDQLDGRSCGPMALWNLDIMLARLKNDQKTFIDTFVRTKFCEQHEVPELEKRFKALRNKS